MPSAISAAWSTLLDEQRDVVADAGADRERGREEAAGHAAPHREPGRDELAEGVDDGRALRAVEQAARVVVAAARGRAAGGERDDGDGQAADRGEDDRVARAPGVDAVGAAGERAQQQAREHAAGDAAEQRDEHARAEQRPADRRHLDHAEVGRVAVDRDRHQAGQHDRRDEQAARALLGPARQLLDREHHAGERRVEGGGDAGRAAGDEQAVLGDRGALGQPAAHAVQHAGGDLHRRAFAAERQAGEQAPGGQQHLGERQTQRDEEAHLGRGDRGVERGHHLRDARAGGAGA